METSIEGLLKLIKEFEKRNNISTYIKLFPDESGTMYEFWIEEELKEFATIEELVTFLKKTSYELAEDGRCYSPVKLKPKDNG